MENVETKKSTDFSGSTKRKSFTVVGIGASAGGYEAFSELLENLPADTGMAYVFISHLSPEHKSFLPELLRKKTSMPIKQASNNMKVEPNHIYIIPPKFNITINDHKLKLEPKDTTQYHPIDYFLITLAKIYPNNSVGIILSGTATDGTIGLKHIKASGGITIAQDESAKFPGMPRSAIESGYADLILSPKNIAKELERITKNKDKFKDGDTKLTENEEEDLRNIFTLVQKLHNVDFTFYKRSTVKRRIVRRMLLNRFNNTRDYLKYLRKNPHEIDELYQDMLINVTDFFRDRNTLAALKENILPSVTKDRNAHDPIRVWIAGCATGEEAYSVAIIILEFLQKQSLKIPVQIFATDINGVAIEKAKTGIYHTNLINNVSEKRLNKFFRQTENGYQISGQLRDMCIFSVHNVFSDPPFSNIDFISCQNLLIYFEPVLQKKVISRFHFALKNYGFLMLGKSETIGNHTEWFSQIDKRKIYKKKPNVKIQTERYPDQMYTKIVSGALQDISRSTNDSEADIEKLAERILLTHYIPACVVVNKNLEILRFSDVISPYLQPSTGRASLNILKMIRTDLADELKNLIHLAKIENKAQIKENIKLATNTHIKIITIEVIPLNATNNIYFLLLFKESGIWDIPKGIKDKNKNLNSIQIVHLYNELYSMRDQVRRITEESEASKEELQSANEEVLAANEELQSINEELETSKEELQSTNEELTTTNEELNHRNFELRESRDYSQAIVETVFNPIIVIDTDCRVRTANVAFYKMFGLTPYEVEGKIFFEIDLEGWNNPKLRKLLSKTINKKIPFSDFEMYYDSQLFGQKVFTLNGRRLLSDVENAGALVVMNDITERKKTEELLRQKEERFRMLVQNSSDITKVIKADGEILYESFSTKKLLGYTPEERIGKNIYKNKIIHPEDIRKIKNTVRQVIADPEGVIKTEIRMLTKSGEWKTFEVYSQNFIDHPRIGGIIENYRDITDRKQAEMNAFYIAEASKVLSSSLDYKLTLKHIAQLAVQFVADWCLVSTLENGSLKQLIITHKDPKMIKWVNFYQKKYPSRPEQTDNQYKVLKTGKPEIIYNISDSLLNKTIKDKKQLQIIRKLGLKSYMIVPIKIQDKPLGTITFITSDSKRCYTNNDLAMAEELAQHSGLAIQNSQLYKKSQEEIAKRARTEETLRKKDKEKETFINIISHELRTPVTSVKAYAQVLHQYFTGPKDAKTKEIILKMNAQIDKLTNLISDFSDINRLQTKRLQISPEEFDVNKMINEVLDSISLTTKKHKIIKKLDKSAKIYADKARISQVLSNVLINAIKFSPHKSDIIVKTELNKDYIIISVQDSGIGIPKSHLSKIFDRYFRGKDHQTKTISGMGLGLYVAKQILYEHNGEIWAESKQGKGSTFYFKLPLKLNIK